MSRYFLRGMAIMIPSTRAARTIAATLRVISCGLFVVIALGGVADEVATRVAVAVG